MTLFCKRTLFEKNTNFYTINKKEYGEDYVKWIRGKLYKSREPEYNERGGKTDLFPGIYLYVESEVNNTWFPITEKIFNKHFETLDKYRNDKIDKILK